MSKEGQIDTVHLPPEPVDGHRVTWWAIGTDVFCQVCRATYYLETRLDGHVVRDVWKVQSRNALNARELAVLVEQDWREFVWQPGWESIVEGWSAMEGKRYLPEAGRWKLIDTLAEMQREVVDRIAGRPPFLGAPPAELRERLEERAAGLRASEVVLRGMGVWSS